MHRFARGEPGQIVTRHSARGTEVPWGCCPMQSADCLGTPFHCIDLPGMNPGKSLRATGRAPQKRRRAGDHGGAFTGGN